jgi:hypothetical protein
MVKFDRKGSSESYKPVHTCGMLRIRQVVLALSRMRREKTRRYLSLSLVLKSPMLSLVQTKLKESTAVEPAQLPMSGGRMSAKVSIHNLSSPDLMFDLVDAATVCWIQEIRRIYV